MTVNIPATAIEIANPSSMVNLLSFYSSSGPATGTNAIKPDLVATGGAENIGGEIYLAAQDYDPLGELFSADRYTSGQGTSFSTPLVSGAAALVKQAHPKYTPAQIKSALVNNTAQGITADENGDLVGIPQLGAGLLNARRGLAVQHYGEPGVAFFRRAHVASGRAIFSSHQQWIQQREFNAGFDAGRSRQAAHRWRSIIRASRSPRAPPKQ